MEKEIEELKQVYSRRIERNYEKLMDYYGIWREAEEQLEEPENEDYLTHAVAASGTRMAEIQDAKTDIDGIVRALGMEQVDTLEDLLMTAHWEWEEGTRGEAAAKAIRDNYERLEEFDRMYYRRSHFEADMGRIQLRASL